MTEEEERVSTIYQTPTSANLLWPGIKADVMTCVRRGGLGIHTEEFVYRKVVTGEWGLWTIHHWDYRRKIIGFFILLYEPNSHMEIVYGHIRPYLEKEVSRAVKKVALANMEDLARSFGCKKILAYSTRMGMDRVLSKEVGYTKAMTIFCKELDETTEEDSGSGYGDDRTESLPEDYPCDR